MVLPSVHISGNDHEVKPVTGATHGFIRPIILFSLVAISTLSALLVMEVFLRLIGFSFHLYPERIEFGWPDPVTMEEQLLPDPDLFWVPAQPKPYTEMLREAMKGKPDIVFMGCSVTAWSRYPFIVLNMLSQIHPDKYVGGINFGVVGWSSFQGLRQMERDIIRIKPKVVTIFFGWNDHWIGFGIEDKEVAKFQSKFYQKIEKLRIVQLLLKSWIVLGKDRREENPLRVSTADFRSNLLSMVDIAQDNGIIPILITAPSSHQKGHEPSYLRRRWLHDLDQLVPLHQEYVSIVRSVAEEKGVVLCDLADDFQKLSQDIVSQEYFYEDGIHFRNACDPVAARLLVDCLLSQPRSRVALGIPPDRESGSSKAALLSPVENNREPPTR